MSTKRVQMRSKRDRTSSVQQVYVSQSDRPSAVQRVYVSRVVTEKCKTPHVVYTSEVSKLATPKVGRIVPR